MPQNGHAAAEPTNVKWHTACTRIGMDVCLPRVFSPVAAGCGVLAAMLVLACTMPAAATATSAVRGNAVALSDTSNPSRSVDERTLGDTATILADAASHGIELTPESRDLLDRLAHGAADAGPAANAPIGEAIVVDGLLRYGIDFVAGKRRPTPVEIENLRDEILAATRTGRLLDWYVAKIPRDPAYHLLRAALRRLDDDPHVWPVIGAGRTLEKGAHGERVGRLRQRLGLAADGNARFDTELELALQEYQALHGLDADGRLGPRTLAHLDTSRDLRRLQVRQNLERHRQQWLHGRPASGTRIVVNLPSYRLALHDDSGELASMKVIIGHPDTPTPALDESIERLEFSPYWYVPDTIAATEVLPSMLRDPGYGQRNGYEILDRRSFRPVTVGDWLTGELGSMLVRQKPGDANALGRVKFVLPNSRSIYLHDTGRPELFARHDRALSHGCIRVEKPALLASLLLRANEGWTEETIASAMSRTTPKVVSPATEVDVMTTYYTVEAHLDGKTSFYEDIYAHDAREEYAMASSHIEVLPSAAPETAEIATLLASNAKVGEDEVDTAVFSDVAPGHGGGGGGGRLDP